MNALASLVEEVLCPACSGAHRKTLYRNVRASGESIREVAVNVVQCGDCGFLFNSPRPDAGALERYYANDIMMSGQVYRDESSSSHYPRLHARRAAFLAKLLGQRSGGLLLDVGCGSGGFLQALSEVNLPGWQLSGLDPSRRAVEVCTARGLEAQRGRIGEDRLFEPASFDAVTAVSVLEHVPDPRPSLAWCRRLLKPDGLLFVEVPDTLQPEVSLTGFFNLEHIVHFTCGTLVQMLQHEGFTEFLRDREAGGVLRMVASSRLSSWGAESDPIPTDDRKAAARTIRTYADEEKQLILGLRERVAATLTHWQALGRRIAVYGAGIHSAQLASLVDITAYACCFIDGDPTKQNQKFMGLPVIAPDDLIPRGIDAVLISSNRFVDEMVRTVRTVGGPGVAIDTCYGAALGEGTER